MTPATWVLIIMMQGTAIRGRAIDHVEFNSKSACLLGALAVKQDGPPPMYTVCVPKD